MSSDVSKTSVPATTGRRIGNPWPIFSLLALIEFMTVLDASVVNVALPSIKSDLGFSAVGLTWVVDAYLVAYAGFLLTGGRAADIVGRRRMFLVGVGVFTLASLACGLSTAGWQLVLSRAVQGLGAALVAPAALALVTDVFPEGAERNKALGIWAGMAGVGGAAGVMLGGLLTTLSWEWVFLVNVPVGILIFVAAARMLPSTRPAGAESLDIAGAVLGTAGLALLIYCVVRGSTRGWFSIGLLMELGVAVVLLLAFLWRQRTARSPLVPARLFEHPHLITGNVVIAFVGALLFATFFVVTLYMQQVRGFSPLVTGLLYVPINASMLLGSNIAPRIAARVGPTRSLMIGLLVQAAALAWWAAVLSPYGSFVTVFLLPAVVWSFGLGASIPSAFMLCTTGVSEAVAGIASGMATTTYQSGGALGLVALTAVASSTTAGMLSEPLATRPEVAEALTAGYGMTLWVGAAVALTGAALTVVTRQRG